MNPANDNSPQGPEDVLAREIAARTAMLSRGKPWKPHMADKELLALVNRWHIACARKRPEASCCCAVPTLCWVG